MGIIRRIGGNDVWLLLGSGNLEYGNRWLKEARIMDVRRRDQTG